VLGSLVAALAACGGEHTTAPPPRRPTPRAQIPRAQLATATTGRAELPRLGRRATLKYEIQGRPFPLPLVSGKIAGRPALMLVDTGANSHVIAGWFARKLGLPLKKLGDVGTDHVGKSIATYRIDKPDIVIDDWGKLSVSTVLAAEVPDVLQKLGIGAFISPQRLDEEGDAVVLDLANGEIRAAWWDEASSDLAESGATLVHPEDARACEENDGPVKGLAFVVPSTIESHEVRLLVDTGAQHSDVFTSSPAGQKLLGQSAGSKEAMYTASGKISARKLRRARVTTGSFTVTTDVDLIQGGADASCPRDGVLAMDVLRSCTLLFGRARMFGRCVSSK
jgi:hypothetical protein